MESLKMPPSIKYKNNGVCPYCNFTVTKEDSYGIHCWICSTCGAYKWYNDEVPNKSIWEFLLLLFLTLFVFIGGIIWTGFLELTGNFEEIILGIESNLNNTIWKVLNYFIKFFYIFFSLAWAAHVYEWVQLFRRNLPSGRVWRIGKRRKC